MWMKPRIEPVPPEPGPPDMPEGAPPDALDGRLGEPPVWPSTLSQYITAHSAAHTQLDAWHTQVSATSSALADQRLWEGPDQQSQATSWANLGAQHVAPAKLAMQSVQESLTAFRTSLAKARQEARELLRKADAHMARAKEWQGLARERLIQAQARLIAAQRAIADAILTAGVATPELIYQEEEAIRELAAATKWQAESIEDGFQAEAEQERARVAAQTGYHAADANSAAALSAIKVPGVPGAGQSPAGADVSAPAVPGGPGATGSADMFANCDQWTPDPAKYPIPLQGQLTEQSCGPAGVQNALAVVGVDPGQGNIIALSDMNPNGTKLPDDVSILNGYLRQNPDAVGSHFGWSSPQYQAALNGQDLVAFRPVTIDQLTASVNSGMPSLVPFRTADDGWHSVNVMEFGTKVDEMGVQQPVVHIWDSLPQPNGIGREVPLNQFLQMWEGHASVLTV